jgi:DNA polymerase-3 subunit beta
MIVVVNREQLLPALNTIGGVVEKKQTLPILGYFLVQVSDGKMQLTATDLEIDIKTSNFIEENDAEESFTLPARKFMDICKALPGGAEIKLTIEDEKVLIRSGQSRYSLSVLPARDYPTLQSPPALDSFKIESRILKHLLSGIAFSMASQDARHYLNGALLDLIDNQLNCVATNGHRLALCKYDLETEHENQQILLPRKGVIELGRLLNDSDDDVEVEFGTNFCRFNLRQTTFTTKLIDGKFPDYQRVIPREPDKSAILEREQFRQALFRTSLLPNERHKVVKLMFSTDKLLLESNNVNHEKAEEELEIDYKSDEINIGFNSEYLLNVVDRLTCKEIAIDLTDGLSSIVMRDPDDDKSLYVVMPIRL